HAEGLSCILRYGWTPESAAELREAFGPRLSVALSRNVTPGDRQRLAWAGSLSRALGAPVVATNDVLFHEPARKPLADVLTCIRRRTTLAAAGRCLSANAERPLRPGAA